MELLGTDPKKTQTVWHLAGPVPINPHEQPDHIATPVLLVLPTSSPQAVSIPLFIPPLFTLTTATSTKVITTIPARAEAPASA